MRKRNRKEYDDRESFSPWESYSDLFCGLLLVFVLLFFFAIFQYIAAREKNNADTAALQEEMRQEQEAVLAMYRADLEDQVDANEEKLKQLESEKKKTEEMQADLDKKGEELKSTQADLDKKGQELKSTQEDLDKKGQELKDTQSDLSKKGEELKSTQEDLDKKGRELKSAQEDLDKKGKELEAAQTDLDKKGKELEAVQTDLDKKGKELEAAQTDLDKKGSELKDAQEKLEKKSKEVEDMKKLLDEQRVEIEKIIGVRQDIIEDLNRELKRNNIQVQADKNTGAIIFESNILFPLDGNELSKDGKEFLAKFAPVYLRVILQDKYKDSIAEIIVEGHTDSSGTYLHNLELSQKRAFSVAEYFMSDKENVLDDNLRAETRKYLTVNGCADKDLIYVGNKVDRDKSRRVEIKFRLMDQEMIQEMDEILSN